MCRLRRESSLLFASALALADFAGQCPPAALQTAHAKTMDAVLRLEVDLLNF